MGLIEIEPIIEELGAAGGAAGPGGGVNPGQLRLFELKGGVPTLLKISLTFAAIGLCALMAAFIDFMQALLHRTVGHIPGVTRYIDSATKWAQNVFVNRIASLYSGVDNEIGHAFYQQARLGRLLGKVALSTAYTVVAITNTLKALVTHQPLAPAVIKIGKTARAAGSRVTIVEQKIVRVTKIVRGSGAVIPFRRIHALETQVKRLQVQEAALQKQVAAKAHPSSLATAAEVTALGLAGLGASWVRCEGSRSLGKGACAAGPQGIERLLEGLLPLALGVSLVELARAEQGVIHEVAGIVRTFWRVP
jgi:hypothetical protein